VTVGPDLGYNGNGDAFVAKVNAAGTSLDYCGYIGGSSEDAAYGVAVDAAGNAYVSGYTNSTEASFPVTVGPDLTYNGGNRDAFVAKVNATGLALGYCGYIGGLEGDFGFGIAVNGVGNAYVTGQTGSDEASFPVTVGPDLSYNGGIEDAFVAKINVAGTALSYCGLHWRVPGRLGVGRRRRRCRQPRLRHWRYRLRRGELSGDGRPGPQLQRRSSGCLRGQGERRRRVAGLLWLYRRVG